jgi:hypothetical protein
MNGKYNVDVREILIMSYEQAKQNKKFVVDLINPLHLPICLCKQGLKKMVFTFPKTWMNIEVYNQNYVIKDGMSSKSMIRK